MSIGSNSWAISSSGSLFVRFPLTFWKTELRVGEISPKMLMGLSGFCGAGPELKMYTTATPAPLGRPEKPALGFLRLLRETITNNEHGRRDVRYNSYEKWRRDGQKRFGKPLFGAKSVRVVFLTGK